MPFQLTTATQKLQKLKRRIRAIPGGSSASKTISILMILIAKAQSDTKPTLTSIVSESIPHLKRGAIRDFKNILKEHKYWRDKNWNVQDSTYTFETGSQIEFFSSDNGDKLRGARRQRLFINEANNVSFEAFEQLEIRTTEEIWLDWNPSTEFWYYTEVKGKRDDIDELTLTYKDNEALDSAIVKSLETRKIRRNWWLVYGLGQLGEIEGKIYKNWQIIEEVPHEARLVARWLDFGYTNDPTSIGEIYYHNEGYIVHELAYQWGMKNGDIADFLKLQEDPQTLIIADSAEPKSIDEIKGYGLNIIGVSKARGETKSDTFVKWSIEKVQDQKISITSQSLETLKEYRNYVWLVDKDGKILNVEDPLCANHSMAGIRYVFVSILTASSLNEDELRARAAVRRRALVNQSR